jgi:hypothetical protein
MPDIDSVGVQTRAVWAWAAATSCLLFPGAASTRLPAPQAPRVTPADDAKRDRNEARSPDTLRAEIDSLRAEKVAWREITWRPCLLDGLKESRE